MEYSRGNNWRAAFSVAAIFIGLTYAPHAAAQSRPTPPFDLSADGQAIVMPQSGEVGAGAWLDSKLQSLIQNCTGSRFSVDVPRPTILNPNRTRPEPATLIPEGVITQWRLRASPPPTLSIQSDERIGRTFGYVFSGQERANRAARSDLLIPFDLNVDVDNYSEEFATGGEMIGTCRTSIRAAVATEAKYKIPPGSLDVAATWDTDNHRRYHVSIITGEFRSPLLRMFDGEVGGARRNAFVRYAGLRMWKFYRDDPGRIGRELHLLSYFNGVSYYSREGTARQSRGTLSGNGSVELGGFRATASGSIEGEESSTLRLSTFEGLVRRDPNDPSRWARFYRSLPTLSEVRDAVSGAGPIAFNAADSDELVVRNSGRPKTIRFYSAEIPPGMCRDGVWTLSTPPDFVGGALSSARVGPGSVGDSEVCEFLVRYTPNDAARRGGATIDVDFTTTLQGSTLTLPMPELSFASYSNPTLSVFSVEPTATGWTVTYVLSDDRLLENPNQNIDGRRIEMQCPDGLVTLPPPEWNLQDGAQRKLIATFTLPAIGGAVTPERIAQYEDCHLGGHIAYTLRGIRGSVERDLTQTPLAAQRRAPPT